MRLIAYIRAVGAEPLPFSHPTFRAYRADLQRQYEMIRSGMDDEAGRQARLMGRALVRLKTLQGAAGDMVPITLSPADKRTGSRRIDFNDFELHVHIPSHPVAPEFNLAPRDVRNCKRKLRHVDFLSALRHAVRLGDSDLHVYPCPVCFGLHVGHDPDRIKLRAVAEELALIEERLAALKLEDHQFQQRKTALLRVQKLLSEADEICEC